MTKSEGKRKNTGHKDNFVGRVNVGYTVTVPFELRNYLKLNVGDLLGLQIDGIVRKDVHSQRRHEND